MAGFFLVLARRGGRRGGPWAARLHQGPWHDPRAAAAIDRGTAADAAVAVCLQDGFVCGGGAASGRRGAAANQRPARGGGGGRQGGGQGRGPVGGRGAPHAALHDSRLATTLDTFLLHVPRRGGSLEAPGTPPPRPPGPARAPPCPWRPPRGGVGRGCIIVVLAMAGTHARQQAGTRGTSWPPRRRLHDSPKKCPRAVCAPPRPACPAAPPRARHDPPCPGLPRRAPPHPAPGPPWTKAHLPHTCNTKKTNKPRRSPHYRRPHRARRPAP